MQGEAGHHVAFIAYGADTSVNPGPEIHFAPHEEVVEQLLDYFMQRYEQNQVLQLRELKLTGGSATNMDISYGLSRYADDLDAERWGPFYITEGKGNVDCQNRKINVWSMAMTVRSEPPLVIPFTNQLILGLCPPTLSTFRAIASGIQSDAVLVCTD